MAKIPDSATLTLVAKLNLPARETDIVERTLIHQQQLMLTVVATIGRHVGVSTPEEIAGLMTMLVDAMASDIKRTANASAYDRRKDENGGYHPSELN